MKLIIGLGNPEPRYDGTRHNVGFEVVDRLAASFQAPFKAGKGKYHEAKCSHRGESLLFIRPTTYMNHSGQAVMAAMQFYKVKRQEMLVICDDLNLPVGTIRLRAKGSDGGQNGLKHIIQQMGTNEFARLRIGIRKGDMPPGSFSSFVLGKFGEEEKKVIEQVLETSADAVLDFALNGIEHAMTRFNKTVA
ncbi:MAG TPA: aminoacyl-tRNA hydrolase [Chlorobaculum parvum]|uniref:Peptidyl-tRNA hydrolase n=1 Tax=Chlorobaculum parvum TaxID=274539 RepID=A0A7C5HIG7_9CHLB|nr:aminoacyl-tRNA hydrolase [Chlorobaculum parvum]